MGNTTNCSYTDDSENLTIDFLWEENKKYIKEEELTFPIIFEEISAYH